jgi:ABC-2 type transport system ATP-binding protein
MPVIDAAGLSKYYGDTRGIEDLSLSVERGEVFGFLGPNGAGKTTAIRTLLGFQSPTAGSATVLGNDIADEQAMVEARRNIGYLPSDPGLDGTVTGERLLEYYGSLRGEERKGELLELFSPPLERPIGEYSRGNKQMLAIVLAFMHDPELVFMDEPTSGLDPIKQERFDEFVRTERENGVTFFMSSHILSEVQKICDRVGIIRNGRLVELENIETLRSRGGKSVHLRVAEAVPPSAFDIDGVVNLTVGSGEDPPRRDGTDSAEATAFSFTFTGRYNALIEHLTDFDVLDFTIEDAPLDEVFRRFYDGSAGPEPDDGTDGEESSEDVVDRGVS